MMNRRRLLLTASALLAPAPAFAEAAGARHAALNALFDRFVAQGLDQSPEETTSLGLDKGPRAAEKSRLDDRSLAAIAENQRLTARQLSELDAFGRQGLTGMDLVNYDTVRFGLVGQVEAAKRFAYAGGNAGAPYVLNQISGAYQTVPDFLDTQHAIETKADADAYLARLEAVSICLDQESEQARHDEAPGRGPAGLRARRHDPADRRSCATRRPTGRCSCSRWCARTKEKHRRRLGAPGARIVRRRSGRRSTARSRWPRSRAPKATHERASGGCRTATAYYQARC